MIQHPTHSLWGVYFLYLSLWQGLARKIYRGYHFHSVSGEVHQPPRVLLAPPQLAESTRVPRPGLMQKAALVGVGPASWGEPRDYPGSHHLDLSMSDISIDCHFQKEKWETRWQTIKFEGTLFKTNTYDSVSTISIRIKSPSNPSCLVANDFLIDRFWNVNFVLVKIPCFAVWIPKCCLEPDVLLLQPSLLLVNSSIFVHHSQTNTNPLFIGSISIFDGKITIFARWVPIVHRLLNNNASFINPHQTHVLLIIFYEL